MALTSWKGTIVRKQDVTIAKNYLLEDELDTLNRLVAIFLETAELRAKNRTSISMKFWQENVNRILDMNDKPVLNNSGTISKGEMEAQVKKRYLEFDKKRKSYKANQADLDDLKQLENKVKKWK